MKTLQMSALMVATTALAGCAQGPAAIRAEPGAIVVIKEGPPADVAALAPKPGAPEGAVEGFAFPSDKGGQLLEQRLKPADKLPALPEAPAQPRLRSVPGAISRPELPLPAGPTDLPRLPRAAQVGLVPRALPDEAPLASQRAEPGVPQRLELPTAAGVRLPAVDVNQPAVLPLLALPVPDREALADPTTAASLQAALAALAPDRTAPAPFVKENLPDPFENSQVVKVRTPPPESPMPYTASPRPPTP